MSPRDLKFVFCIFLFERGGGGGGGGWVIELSRFNLVNIMAADALAPCVALTSAAMILTI